MSASNTIFWLISELLILPYEEREQRKVALLWLTSEGSWCRQVCIWKRFQINPYSSLITVLQTIPVVQQNGSSPSWQPARRSSGVVNRELCSGGVSKNSMLSTFSHLCQKQPLTHAALAPQQKRSCGFTDSITSTRGKQMLVASCCLGGTVLIAGNFKGEERSVWLSFSPKIHGEYEATLVVYFTASSNV